MPAYLHVYVPDTDAFYARAVRGGAISVIPSQNAPYGDRAAKSKSRGNTWFLAHVFRYGPTIAARVNVPGSPGAVRRLMASLLCVSFPYSNTLSW
jgi:hypothetical protein